MKKLSLERSTVMQTLAASVLTAGLALSLPASASTGISVTPAGPDIGADLQVPVLPQLLNFGSGIEFTTYTLAVFVVNNTSQSITITRMSVPFTNCVGCFSVDTPVPIVVAPHGRQLVPVHWSPVAGFDLGAIVIEHSLGVSTSVVIGHGIPF